MVLLDRRNVQSGARSRGRALTLTTAALLLACPAVDGRKSPLASIRTHHGIDLDSLHLNKRGGGATATRRRRSRKRRFTRRAISPPKGAEAEEVVPGISTSYSLNPAAVSKSLSVSIADAKQDIPQKEGLTPTAITCMALLALQYGIQPVLVKKYTPQTIVRSSVVLVQEVVKFAIAGGMYFLGTKKEAREKELKDWSVKKWIALAGLPAFLYTIQNMAALMAYQNLEALTFNVLNQTKILSAALCCYFVMGKRQSRMQVLSLGILIASTLVIERILHPGALVSLLTTRGGTTDAFGSLASALNGAGRRVTHGIVPILLASLISGMAGALTQRNLQGSRGRSVRPGGGASRPPRNAYLFSMEMNVASAIILVASLLLSSDGRGVLRSRGFFADWTPETFIPVVTNSVGGVLVGLVTKHAGSVRKGFALIFGLLLSGILQAGGAGVGAHQIAGGLLAAFSLWMHTVHPYKPPLAAEERKEA